MISILSPQILVLWKTLHSFNEHVSFRRFIFCVFPGREAGFLVPFGKDSSLF